MSAAEISVAIITKNEESRILSCLESVKFAGQIVVVDSGSTDGTVRIARDFGCDVYVEDWKGFGAQKQSAIDKCRSPWILVLDADEHIPAETGSKLIEISESGGAAGYSFPRKNFFQGRWIRHMGWWPDRVVRYFRKGRGRMSDSAVHESVIIDGRVAELDCPIEHFTESDLGKILLKINQYSTLGAEQEFSKGRKCSVWEAALRAKLAFLQNYVLRLGFLDGRQGFTLSMTDAINKFSKYAKLSALNMEAKKRNDRPDNSHR
jgi:glycosyltransferase involved in cell wall biosynthesis